jgi:hypothetical protein
VATFRSDWLVTPGFHPEFGLLYPSPRRRRRMRLTMSSMMAGIGTGATIELAVAHWCDSVAVAKSLAAETADEELLAEDAAIPEFSGIPIASVRLSASAAATDAWTVLRPQGSCKDAAAKDLAASFLDSTCRPGKMHTRHAGRSPNRIATIMVGRTEPPSTPLAVEASALHRDGESESMKFVWSSSVRPQSNRCKVSKS